MKVPVAAPHKEPRSWKRSDVASAFLTFMILYALSPPWVIALCRVTRAPTIAVKAVAFCYHPLSVMRQTYPPVDRFYKGYRILLSPYLSGIY